MHRVSRLHLRITPVVLGAILAVAGITCGHDGMEAPPERDVASLVVLRGGGQTGTAGTALLDSLVVEVEDDQGAPVAGAEVSFAITSGDAGAEVRPGRVTTDASGRAAALGILGRTAGTWSAEARTNGRSGVLVARVVATVHAAAADTLIVGSGQDQGGRVEDPLTDSLVVRVTDRFGNPVAGVEVRWSAVGGGSVSDAVTTTGEDGRAGVLRVLGARAGEQSALAEADGLKGSPATFYQVAAARDAAALLPLSGGGQSGPVGGRLAQPLVVEATDELGNPIAGRAITWTVSDGGGIDDGQGTTGPDGRESVGWTLGTSTGEQTATAVAAGLPPITFRATAQPGAPAALAIATQPSANARSGVTFQRAPEIRLADAYGNPTPATGVSITAALAADAGGTLGGTRTVTSADGVALFDDLAITGITGTYSLHFTAPGIPAVTSAAITLAAGPPAAVQIVTQPSAVAQSGQPLAQQPAVQVRDGGGNAVGGVDVRAAIESGGGTLSGTTTVTTGSNGMAAYANLAISGSDGDRVLRFTAQAAFALSGKIGLTGSTGGTMGSWSSVFPWPVVAVHLALLPDGKVLSWGKGGNPQVWDPATGSFREVPSPALLFCAGHAFLPDGRLLVTGGHIANQHGLPAATIFDPVGERWSVAPDMGWGRWYPTSTTLPNGEVLTLAGSDQNGVDVPTPEVWTTSGTWRTLPNANLVLPYYPRMFVAPNGLVFMAGPARMARYLDTRGNGSWTDVGTMSVYRSYGSAVMYQPGKVVVMGGGGADSNSTPTNSVEVIDLTRASPAWRAVQPMQFARRHLNATLLPTGEVLVTGGTSAGGFNNAAGAVHAAEIWNPATERWTTLASNQVIRMYHSTTLLLPDGRVLHTGSGDGGGAPRELNAEIFSPPYLFRGSRPVISTAPGTAGYDQDITVSSPQASSIALVTLIRLSAVTHAFNQNQRFNRLEFTGGSESLTVRMPANPNLAPPGHYLLFLVDDNGVPSMGKVVQLR